MAWIVPGSSDVIQKGAGTVADRKRLYALDKERERATPQRQAVIDAEMDRLSNSIWAREEAWLEKNKGKV